MYTYVKSNTFFSRDISVPILSTPLFSLPPVCTPCLRFAPLTQLVTQNPTPSCALLKFVYARQTEYLPQPLLCRCVAVHLGTDSNSAKAFTSAPVTQRSDVPRLGD